VHGVDRLLGEEEEDEEKEDRRSVETETTISHLNFSRGALSQCLCCCGVIEEKQST